MKFSLDSGDGRCRIRSSDNRQLQVLYSPLQELEIGGGSTVQELNFASSVLITPLKPVDWRPQHFDEVTRNDFACLLDFSPEIVVYGSGEAMHFPAHELTRDLIEAGVGLEVMNTPAACRTYNLLMMEGRLVVAALLLGC